jgi:hypothetical protein
MYLLRKTALVLDNMFVTKVSAPYMKLNGRMEMGEETRCLENCREHRRIVTAECIMI